MSAAEAVKNTLGHNENDNKCGTVTEHESDSDMGYDQELSKCKILKLTISIMGIHTRTSDH